jgi:hypothetical protein
VVQAGGRSQDYWISHPTCPFGAAGRHLANDQCEALVNGSEKDIARPLGQDLCRTALPNTTSNMPFRDQLVQAG